MITECLLIDDDIDDQEIFQMALKKVSSDIQCVMIKDAVEALDRLKGDRLYVPGCLFLDINMPKMTGLECLEENPETYAFEGCEDIHVFDYFQRSYYKESDGVGSDRISGETGKYNFIGSIVK